MTILRTMVWVPCARGFSIARTAWFLGFEEGVVVRVRLLDRDDDVAGFSGPCFGGFSSATAGFLGFKEVVPASAGSWLQDGFATLKCSLPKVHPHC